ncbi:MAG: hypothetical protein ACRDO1_07035, partial [Nocardioidaceae bacterium]
MSQADVSDGLDHARPGLADRIAAIRRHPLLDRAVALGRRVAGAPEWPLAAAALLGLLAMVEVSLRVGDRGAAVSTAMLLGLGCTLPLALARTQVVPAATIIVASTLLTLAVLGGFTGAGLVALLVVLYLLGRGCPPLVPTLLVLPFLAYAVFGPFDRAGGG